MKKFFRLVSMLALAGLAFTYTSCTDYSEDIDKNSEEIQSLSNELATAKQQVESMKTDISNLQTAKTEAEKAIAALQTTLTTLQTKHEADVKALKEEYAKADVALKDEIQKKIDALKTAHEKEVGEIKTTIDSLQKSVTDLEKKVKSIEDAIKTLATQQDLSDAKAWVKNTFVTKDTMKVVNTTLGTLQTRLTAAENKVASLNGKYDSELKISEILAKIKTAQAAADSAEAHAQKALGNVDALKTALGVYANNGKLAAEIVLLQNADSKNAADINDLLERYKADSTATVAELANKFNSADFQKTFDDAIKAAVANDGVVDKAIAAQIATAKETLEAQINDLKKYVDAKFNYLYSVAKQLKSLVFVPDLYVDGIEATEYTYADYIAQVASLGNTNAKEGVYFDYGTDDNGVAAKVLNGKWLYSNELNKQKNAVHSYLDPKSVITYKMNPSGANVTAGTPLTFISDDKEFLKTKTSVKNPVATEFVSAENGELKVNMTAVGQNANRKGEDGYVSIFALQATVKNGEGQDTTVTSDFARLYTGSLKFENLAFTKDIYGNVSQSCVGITTQKHIYSTLKDAVENAPSVKVKYDETLDLKTVVTNHFTSRKHQQHADYAKVYPYNDYGVTYTFDYIDYQLGTNVTSETQHVWLNGDVFTPCGVTSDKGERDTNAIGAEAFTSVGRRPIVRVEMKIGSKVVLAGFIKFEIVKQTEYKVADPFKWTYRFFCAGDAKATTWSQIENNVIKISGNTKEEFCKLYKLQTLDGSLGTAAVQYTKGADGNFHKLPCTISKVNYSAYGTVVEIKDDVPGTTTDIIKWTLPLSDLSAIYRANGHEVTIWVRYIYSTVDTPTTDYEGIYVPLTAVVDKPVSSVNKKLSNYWFNNLASAKINVAVPFATNEVDPTKPWTTNINQVWEKNAPQFDFGVPYTQTVDGQEYSYKYYFAPEQPSYTINGLIYQFYVNNCFINDKFIGRQPAKGNITKNSDVKSYEDKFAANADEGIYANTVLYCKVIQGKTVSKTFTVATIDPAKNTVTYADNDDAKFLLNHYASVPSQYAEAILRANIGVTAFCNTHVAMPLEGAISPYHFLRPVNAVAAADKFFVDAADQHKDESNINVLDAFSFVDWRGEAFFTPAKGETSADYSNLWYFKYYHISSIEVDLENVTTTLDGGDITKTLLSDKTDDINLEHWSGDRVTPDFKSTAATPKALNITISTVANPTEWAKDAETKYEWLVKKFGYIHYHNNGTPIETPFTLRVPVKFNYTWGTINASVDILVKNL